MYIRDYLQSRETFSAEGIGSFTTTKQVAANGAPLVEFTYNKAVGTTVDLISFIAEKEVKNKIVIGFDVESYFIETRQFINLGNPWVIPGFGHLQLGRNREFEFVQDSQAEAVANEKQRLKQGKDDVSEYFPERKVNTNRMGGVLLTVILLVAAALAVYYFIYTNKQKIKEPTVNTADTAQTTPDTLPAVASAPIVTPDTTPKAPTASTTPAGMLRFVITSTPYGEYARKRFATLKAYGVNLNIDSATNGSTTTYKIFVLKPGTLQDTTHLKDSMTRYFGKAVVFER